MLGRSVSPVMDNGAGDRAAQRARSHRDFTGRKEGRKEGVLLAVAHPNPWASASSYLSSQPLADSRSNLHTTKNLCLAFLLLMCGSVALTRYVLYSRKQALEG